MSSYYLEHHGILGQKWGKRNGPPYPLSEKDAAKVRKHAENIQEKFKTYEKNQAKRQDRMTDAEYKLAKELNPYNKDKKRLEEAQSEYQRMQQTLDHENWSDFRNYMDYGHEIVSNMTKDEKKYFKQIMAESGYTIDPIDKDYDRMSSFNSYEDYIASESNRQLGRDILSGLTFAIGVSIVACVAGDALAKLG